MKELTEFCGDTRGVSTVIGYTALLGITAIILVSVIAGANAIMTGQTNIVATDQLETSSTKLSDEIVTVHRMATKSTETNPEITSTVSLPEDTVEGQYFIEVTNDNVIMETSTTDVSVVTPLPSNTNTVTVTTNGRIDGGDVTISYSGSGDITITEATQ